MRKPSNIEQQMSKRQLAEQKQLTPTESNNYNNGAEEEVKSFNSNTAGLLMAGVAAMARHTAKTQK